MLGNNKHFYPGQDDKDGENEEEEEEHEGEDGKEEPGRDAENGELESLEDMTGGRQSWEGKGGNGMKPAAIVVGRQRADRPLKQANLGSRGVPYMSNHTQAQHHVAIKQQYHLNAANQQPLHPGLNALHKRRALRERSMTTVALQEDAFLTMMVFRIGIPDIKQTVGARSNERHSCHCQKKCLNQTKQCSTHIRFASILFGGETYSYCHLDHTPVAASYYHN